MGAVRLLYEEVVIPLAKKLDVDPILFQSPTFNKEIETTIAKIAKRSDKSPGRVIEDILQGKIPGDIVTPQTMRKVEASEITFPNAEFAKRYPQAGESQYMLDPKTGKLFDQKVKTGEELALEKARAKANKTIKAGEYKPMYPVEDRYYVDPKNYNIKGNTLDDAVPKKEATRAAHYKKFNTKKLKKQAIDAYNRGMSKLSQDWYAMGQLEKSFIDELGEVKGRAAFKERFADAMAATTGKSDPGSNLLQAAYASFRKTKKIKKPGAAFEIPTPIGGMAVTANQAHFDDWVRSGSGLAAGEHPKRFNFSSNFLGDVQRMTLDEQMVTPLIGKGAPSKIEYGVLESVLDDVAKELGVAPAMFQDVAWAGFKQLKDPKYTGKPMIQWVNEMIQRTSQITGKTPKAVLKGFIRGNMPMYGLGGAAVLGGATGSQEAQAGPGRELVEQLGKKLKAYHYSNSPDPLRRLSGDAYGQGHRGADYDRVMAGPEDLRQREHFYAEGSFPQQGRATPRPEGSLAASSVYGAQLDNVYDLAQNPLGFKGSGTALERQIKDAGFNGFVNDKGMVVYMKPSVEVERLGPYRAAAEDNIARMGRVADEPQMVTAESIPSDPSTEMGEWFQGKPMGVREQYTDEVAGVLEQEGIFDMAGVEDYGTRTGYGTYKGDTNPNTIITTNTEQEAKSVADLWGGATQQDAVPYINRKGGGPAGVKATMREGQPPGLLDDMYQQTGLDGTRTSSNIIDVVNFTEDMPDDQFIDTLAKFFDDLKGVDRVKKYKSGGDYNPTDHLWKGVTDTTGLRPGEREGLATLRRRVEETNRRFRKQHGYADPRGLAVLATITGVGAGLLSQESEAGKARSLSRLSRAREQGYDTDRVLYHGTPSEKIEGGEFRLGPHDETAIDSLSLTHDPSYASDYAMGGYGRHTTDGGYLDESGRFKDWVGEGVAPQVIPVYVRGKTIDFLDAADLYESKHGVGSFMDASPEDFAKSMGEEGITGVEMFGDEVAMLDTSAIRSKYAQFKDPTSRNLLASGTGAAVTGGLLSPRESEAGPIRQAPQQGLLDSAIETAGKGANFVFDALELPIRYGHGASAAMQVLAEGHGVDQALARWKETSGQTLEEIGQELGKYTADKTWNPYLAALVDAVTNVTSPF